MKLIVEKYYLPGSELDSYENLRVKLGSIEYTALARRAFEYFAEHKPEKIEAMPRAQYRSGLPQYRFSITMDPDDALTIKQWSVDYSVSKNQIYRQALILLAESVGIEWGAKVETRKMKEEWMNTFVDIEIAMRLTGVSNSPIHRAALQGKIDYINEDFPLGKRKRKFRVSDLIKLYNVPDAEVDRFFMLGVVKYKDVRDKESHRGAYKDSWS